MGPRSSPPLLLALCDAAAILIFVTIGLLAHHKGLTLSGYARDTLPLGGAWFAAAALFHLYSRRAWWRVLATWACGIPVGVLVRALILGHRLNGGEAAFLGVCLAVIGLFVALLRSAVRLSARVGVQT